MPVGQGAGPAGGLPGLTGLRWVLGHGVPPGCPQRRAKPRRLAFSLRPSQPTLWSQGESLFRAPCLAKRTPTASSGPLSTMLAFPFVHRLAPPPERPQTRQDTAPVRHAVSHTGSCGHLTFPQAGPVRSPTSCMGSGHTDSAPDTAQEEGAVRARGSRTHGRAQTAGPAAALGLQTSQQGHCR